MEGQCFECGMPAVCSHHVVPKSRGGVNTVGLCGFCHAKAHHRNGNMDSSVLTQQALDARRKKGQICGALPFGYELGSDGLLIEIPHEQIVIKKILNWRDSGASLRAIAQQLDAELIPTKKGVSTQCTKHNSTGKVRQGRSGHWSHLVVRAILARPRWSHSSITSILKAEKNRNNIPESYSEINKKSIHCQDAAKQLRLF